MQKYLLYYFLILPAFLSLALLGGCTALSVCELQDSETLGDGNHAMSFGIPYLPNPELLYKKDWIDTESMPVSFLPLELDLTWGVGDHVDLGFSAWSASILPHVLYHTYSTLRTIGYTTTKEFLDLDEKRTTGSNDDDEDFIKNGGMDIGLKFHAKWMFTPDDFPNKIALSLSGSYYLADVYVNDNGFHEGNIIHTYGISPALIFTQEFSDHVNIFCGFKANFFRFEYKEYKDLDTDHNFKYKGNLNFYLPFVGFKFYDQGISSAIINIGYIVTEHPYETKYDYESVIAALNFMYYI